MRIHTNDPDAVLDTIHGTTRKMHGVSANITKHGSRSRTGAIELKLTGTSNRRVNAGTARNIDRFNLPYAATYDEWGVVLAAIFEADPDAFAGSAKNPVYRDFDHFHYATGARFDSGGLPEDTHQDHRWEFVAPGEFACGSCSAVKCR